MPKAQKQTQDAARFDSKWFHQQFEAQGIPERSLAKVLKLSPSAVSRLLNGHRRITVQLAVELSRFLSVPLDEIMARAGISAQGLPTSEESVKVSGWIDEGMEVHIGTPKGPKTAPKAAFGSPNTKVLRYQTASTKLDGLDGGLVYFEPRADVDLGAIGRVCVVEVSGGAWKLRIPKKSYRAGRYNLHALDGSLREEEVQLSSASPVVWMRF